jgi:hypothetical protein
MAAADTQCFQASGILVTVMSTVPGQSEIAVLEAALRCLAEALQEARRQAIPGQPLAGQTAGEETLAMPQAIPQWQAYTGQFSVRTFPPAFMVHGPRTAAGSGLFGSFLPEGIEHFAFTQEAWAELKPYPQPPLLPIKDKNISAQMHILMHDAALLFALVTTEATAALGHPDILRPDVGQYGDTRRQNALHHYTRLKDLKSHLMNLYGVIASTAVMVFTATDHILEEKAYHKAMQEMETDMLTKARLKASGSLP